MLLWTLLVSTVAIVIAAAKFFGDKYTTSKAPAKKINATHFPSGGKGSKTPLLSIVIPAYNEEERLSPTLTAISSFCEEHINSAKATFKDYEMILVDDCSKDSTKSLAEKFANANPNVKFGIVAVNPNRGKGHAVRQGFLHSHGDLVIMADADNATEFADVAKVITAMNEKGAKIGIGSRAHLEADAIAQRTLGRTILMKGFHLVVAVTYFIGSLGNVCRLHDTQCGFKVFSRKETEILFLNNRLERWAFDVELLLLAKRVGGLEVVEVPVRWQEIPGSKVRISGMVQMGLECLLMCFTYSLGLWPIRRFGC